MRPLVLVEGERVVGMCARASAQGICEGELVSQALGRCSDACVIEADLAHYRRVWESLVDLLGQFSPTVEPAKWGVAYLDATGMGRLYGDERAWFMAIRQRLLQEQQIKVQLGVAATKFGACVAARASQLGPGYRIVAEDDRSYLASFPVDWLPLSDEALRRLGLLGIHTMGRFAELSSSAVAEQFGPESLEAHRWARGQDDRPVIGQQQKVLEAHVEFEVPETRLEPLLAAMLIKSQQGLRDLKRRGLAVKRVEIQLRFCGGTSARGSVWVGDLLGPRKLRAILENLLAGLTGEGDGVMEGWLRMVGLELWVGKQLGLFAHAESRQHMASTLRKLASKHSSGRIVQACIVAPNTPLVGHRYGLREFSL